MADSTTARELLNFDKVARSLEWQREQIVKGSRPLSK
jgi:hypothetical protein